MSRPSPKIAHLMLLVLLVALVLGLSRPDNVSALWILTATLPLFPFVNGPIRLRQTHWTALKPSFEPFDPEGPEAPPEFRESIPGAARRLESLGFERLGTFRARGSVPNAELFVVLFRNAETAEMARLLATVVDNGATRAVSLAAILFTDFSDGTEVATGNRTYPPVFPPRRPPSHGMNFPRVRGVGHLLAIHRARVRPFDAGRTRVDPTRNFSEDALLRFDHQRFLDDQLARGYAYNDEPAGVQRLTWKGAILMTHRLLPPFKQLRMAREESRAARLIRDLDRELAGREAA